MDITNLQNFLLNQAQTTMPALGGRNGASGSQPRQKTDSFASKLNNAVERSANGNDAIKNEAARPPADMEKTAISNGKNDTINEKTQPNPTSEDSLTTDIPNTAGSEQPLTDVAPEIPDEFLDAASLMAPMPPVANITGENTETQFSTLQDNFFRKFLERPILALTAEELKSLPPEAVKILENLFASINDAAKGQVITQAVAEEFLTIAKQEWDALTAKGELPKISESEVFRQQMADTAKQPQDKFQLTNPADALAKLEAGLVKPGAGLVKPEVGLVKPEAEPQKPAIEFAKLTVIDATKPAAEIVKPNLEQQNAVETTMLTTKESAEQNFSNRQNTGGQQSFGQMTESNLAQIKNPDQPVNNSQPFTVFSETVPQNQTEKLEAAQTQQTATFTTPRDEFQIKEQIVQHATLINRSAQESEMLIRLKPEHLGEMALKVTVVNGVVNATFHSNNAEVRSILENSLQQLKNDLANAGFKVDNVSISAGLSQFTADQERAMQWQQQQNRRFSGKTGEEGYADAVESVTASQQGINTSKDDGVDYRI